jgi:hypothetical protein
MKDLHLRGASEPEPEPAMMVSLFLELSLKMSLKMSLELSLEMSLEMSSKFLLRLPPVLCPPTSASLGDPNSSSGSVIASARGFANLSRSFIHKRASPSAEFASGM